MATIVFALYLIMMHCVPKSAASLRPSAPDEPLQTFLDTAEQLVMNSIDRALDVTKNVYSSWKPQMMPDLCRLACPLMQTYVDAVNWTQQRNASYTEKRKLFGRFRATNAKIETLQNQLPSKGAAHHRFSYSLISKEFYSRGHNTTDFDNLYLDFMHGFEAASQQLWRHMGELVVEQQEDLLEILDEISNEGDLSEKDKLYDEFIETYLFKKKKEDL